MVVKLLGAAEFPSVDGLKSGTDNFPVCESLVLGTVVVACPERVGGTVLFLEKRHYGAVPVDHVHSLSLDGL